MRPDVKTVRKALRVLNLKSKKGDKDGKHEVWKNRKGRKVELAKDGKDVPESFVHIFSVQLETQGICTRRDFKKLLRQAQQGNENIFVINGMHRLTGSEDLEKGENAYPVQLELFPELAEPEA